MTPTEFELSSIDHPEGFRTFELKAVVAEIGGLLFHTTWLGVLITIFMLSLGDSAAVQDTSSLLIELVGMDLATLFQTLLVLVVMRCVWLFVRHRKRMYVLNEVGLHVRSGVFSKTHSIIPRNRVQHADISSSYLQRKLGLAKLAVYTAGARQFLTVLNHLSTAEAERLLRELIRDNSDA